ncbi:hypothetical protein PUN28_013126 [Cardiocondyla obscurior]|uniref:Uncharacterized protein n=1 Tax=Cardiocondyla obscurior TaxID=286306 RepID=A0AAW2F755_9HYME
MPAPYRDVKVPSRRVKNNPAVTIFRFALRHCRRSQPFEAPFRLPRSTRESETYAGEPGRRKRSRNPIVVYAVRRNPPRKQSSHPSIAPCKHPGPSPVY